jgi:predicted aldo/keto reductase-like oxidoreductase
VEEKRSTINRRNFLKTMGATGLSTVFAGCKGEKEKEPSAVEPNAPEKTQEIKLQQVPRRELGKTGVKVPCLCMGGTFNFVENQIILRKSLEWGVSFWDTANGYIGGNSELGIGKLILENPGIRKKLFISTKASEAKTVVDLENCLQTSLKRMNTKYIDLYCGVYQLSGPVHLTNELRQWAKSAKKRKLIRFFGFSTHKNMAQCLSAAAKLDWIDAILTSYNFRLVQDAKMQAAVEACHRVGIGLIAIKTQGYGLKIEKDNNLARHLLQRGFTEAQAKIKLVLEDKRFSSACVGMGNIAHLFLNVAAVMDKTKLTQADKEAFKEYAQSTCSGYCAGCAYICDSVLPDVPYISDIMRYLMYCNSYGEQSKAKELFAQIPANVRNKLLTQDYSPVEARCPQHLPIRRLVGEAIGKLA